MHKTFVRPQAFFALTYALSWLIWIPLDLSHFRIGPFYISEDLSGVIRLLGVLAPAVSALILTARSGGREALRGLVGRLAIWQVSWFWWLAALLGQPVLLGVSGLLYNWFGGQPPVKPAPMVSAVALMINIFFLAIATLGEEIGWRGVALPTLQSKHSAFKASLILGFLWAAWHLPFWLLLDTFDQFGWGYLALNFLFVLPMTFYITWFFNHGRSSLLLVAASHLSFNILNTALFPVTASPGAFALFIGLNWVIAILLLPYLKKPDNHQLVNS